MVYFQSVLSEDVETQKRGAVLIIAGNEKATETFVSEQFDDFISIIKNRPCRVAAYHKALPEGASFLFMKQVWLLMLTSKDERVRTKFHGDLSLLETQYELLAYGIPVPQIPRTHTGNIKIKNHMQWIKTRKAIDEIRKMSPDMTSWLSGIISHPGNHDVLFSKGGNTNYSGNAEFLHDVSDRLEVFLSNQDHVFRQMVREEIIASVEARGGRFLQLQQGGWWEEISLDKVHEKITASIYDYRRRMSGKSPLQSSASDTSMFQPNHKRQKVGVGIEEGLNCEFRCW